MLVLLFMDVKDTDTQQTIQYSIDNNSSIS